MSSYDRVVLVRIVVVFRWHSARALCSHHVIVICDKYILHHGTHMCIIGTAASS